MCLSETQTNILIEEKDQLSKSHSVPHTLQICLVSKNHPLQTVPNQQLLMKSRQGNVISFPVTVVFFPSLANFSTIFLHLYGFLLRMFPHPASVTWKLICSTSDWWAAVLYVHLSVHLVKFLLLLVFLIITTGYRFHKYIKLTGYLL